MAEVKKRVIFLKLSGERLAKDGTGWQADSLKLISRKLAAAYKLSQQIGIEGMVLVPGAGNIIRGEQLKSQGIAKRRADMLGRIGTLMNSLTIAEALKDLRIPVEILIAKSMEFKDANLSLPQYSVKRAGKLLADGKLVIIAGGSGKNNVTTDYSVAFYAGDYRREFPTTEVVVLKGTKHDGVYERDPKKVKSPRRFRTIGAPMMQRDYQRFSAVDERSLQEIIKHKLEMLVYADDKHDLETILRHDFTDNKNTIGTLIVAGDVTPVFY